MKWFGFVEDFEIFFIGNTSPSHCGDAKAAGERLRAQKSVRVFKDDSYRARIYIRIRKTITIIFMRAPRLRASPRHGGARRL
jgi:hypothetical protein